MDPRPAREFQPIDLGDDVFRPLAFRSLAEELMAEETYRQRGKNARTLARHERMTSVLSVVRRGEELHEHVAPGPVILVGISGKVRLSRVGGAEEIRIEPGIGACFSPDLSHKVIAEEDSAFLIIIGGKVDRPESG